MNFEKIKKLKARLEEIPEEEFNMEYWGHESACGTSFCLAGHAILMEGGKFDPNEEKFYMNGKEINPFTMGCEILGLSVWEAKRLFYAHDLISIGHALNYLDRLMEQENA